MFFYVFYLQINVFIIYVPVDVMVGMYDSVERYTV